MSTVAKKIIMGSGAVDVPSDDNFNTVGFLSHFDGANNGVNNVFDDGSTSDHTITAAGGVTQGSFSPFSRPDGEWGLYNGVNVDGNYLSAADSNDWAFGSGNFTVEVWVFATSVGDFNKIVGQWPDNGGTTANAWTLETVGAALDFYANIGGSATKVAEAGSNLPLNEWVHVAIVRNGDNHTLYQNGTGGTTVSNSSAYDAASGALEIGSFSNLSGGSWDGYISQVRVVKGTAVYTSDFTPPIAPLTAISGTVLLTCQSNRFIDNSDSAHAITVAGTPKITSFSPLATEAYDTAVNGGSQINGHTTTPTDSDIVVWSTQAYTIECWVYQTSALTNNANGNTALLGAAVASGSGEAWSFGPLNNGNVRFYYYNDAAITTCTSSTAVKHNEWTHLAFVHDGSNNMAIYQNGVRTETDTISGTPFNGDITFVIGTVCNQAFPGNISDVRITHTAVYSGSTYTVPTAPLTAITGTKFLSNMTNAQAFDNAAHNNMTLLGNAKISTTQEKIGNSSLYVDGTGDYLTFPENAANDIDGGTDWTVEFYFRPTQASIDSSLIEIVSKEAGFQLYMSAAEMGLAVSANNTGTYIFNTVTGTDLSADTWYHIAAVHYGNTYKMYVDGTLTAINTTSTSNASTGAKWEIGGYIGGQYPTQGYIDEFRISKIARYTSNFTPDTEPFPDRGEL